MKFYYKLGTEKLYRNFKPAGNDVVELPKPPHPYSVPKSTKEGGVNWVDDKDLKERYEHNRLAEVMQEWGLNLMKYLLGIIFDLNESQKVNLLTLKVYVEETGQFPPLEVMKEKAPDLMAIVQEAISDGDVPPFPTKK